MTICCLTENSPSSGGSVQRVLDLFRGILLFLTSKFLWGLLSYLWNKIASGVSPAFKVHGHMPARILCSIVTTVGSQLFYSWRDQGLYVIAKPSPNQRIMRYTYRDSNLLGGVPKSWTEIFSGILKSNKSVSYHRPGLHQIRARSEFLHSPYLTLYQNTIVIRTIVRVTNLKRVWLFLSSL